MNAAKMAKSPSVRMLLTGYPGAGKTGALASLANAGLKLRILDFDGNPESLIQYTKREFLKNIDVASLEDSIGAQGAFLGVKGLPQAFMRALKLLDHWTYTDPDGEVVDLGKSSTWGPDTVVVVDGMTGLSQACFAHAQAVSNKTPLNTTQAVWGLAIHNQLQFIKRLTAAGNAHHVVMISHLKMVGPKMIDGDGDVNKEVKQAAQDLIPTRLYPTALGQQLPQTISGEFPVVAHLGVQHKGGNKMVRAFQLVPTPEMDIKLPVKDLAALAGVGVETGLWEIFKALGVKSPLVK